MGELRTEAWKHNTSGRFMCQLCGASHEQNMAGVRLMDGDERVVWDICPSCIAAGPRIAAERMRRWALGLVEQAEDLRAWAERVEVIEDWAGLDALARAELASEAHMVVGDEVQCEGCATEAAYVEAHLPGRVRQLEGTVSKEDIAPNGAA